MAQPKEKIVATKDMVSKAVMDLETWKTEQKKKFNENLLNIEAQHLNLLGQEWKEMCRGKRSSCSFGIRQVKRGFEHLRPCTTEMPTPS